MAGVTLRSDFGAQENKICHCFCFFPSVCIEVMGLDAMILVFWMVSFKPDFSLPSFTLIKRLFRSSSLSAFRVVLFAYLRLYNHLYTLLFSEDDISNFNHWMAQIHKSLVKVCVCCVSRSVMSNSVTPWTEAHQPPLSLGFPRQEHWSGLSFASPGDLPNPGVRPAPRASCVSCTGRRTLYHCATWEAHY